MRAMRTGALIAVVAGAVCAAAWAQSAPPAPPSPPPGNATPKPAPAPAKKPAEAAKGGEKKPAGDALPGLDELLGIPKGDRPQTRPEGDPGPVGPDEADPHRMELERALTDRQVSEMFQQAVQQMSDAADLLMVAGDVGIRTQRVQEDIITKLEALIDEAEKQASKQQSSSQDQQEEQQQQQQKVASQPQPEQSQDNEQRQGENRGERTPPGFREGALPDVLDSARAAWGSLPARIREKLLQGTNDKFSSIYQSLTAEYYKRLAEQEQAGNKP